MVDKVVSNITKDIIDYKPQKDATTREIMNVFYNIMRKYDIKEGIPFFNEKNEIIKISSNFEWVMYKTFFLEKVLTHLKIELLIDSVPEDLKK